MPKYVKKPIVVDAFPWFGFGDCNQESGKFLVEPYRFESEEIGGDRFCKHCKRHKGVHGWVKTLEGGHIVCPGDFIIIGVAGEVYPCKPGVFAQTYDPVPALPKEFTKEEMETAKGKLDAVDFKQEYEGEFVEERITDELKLKDGTENIVSGILLRSDEPTVNSHIYTKEALKKAISSKALGCRISNRAMVGTLFNQNCEIEPSINGISHLVTKVGMNKSGDLIAEAQILNTKEGFKIFEALEAKKKVIFIADGKADNCNLKKTGDRLVIDEKSRYELTSIGIQIL